MVFDFWFYFMQGVPGIIASLALTKTLALICDIRKGRLSDVPDNFYWNGKRLNPRTSLSCI